MTFRLVNKKHVKKAVFLVTVFALIFSVGTSAWSYDGRYTIFNYDVSRETLYKNSLPSSAKLEVCKSLLEINSNTSSKSDISRNQRKAGKVAALGIILGARFALEPKRNDTHTQSPQEILLVRHDNKNNNKVENSRRTALSIAAYRNCQKEYILSKVILN